MDNLKNAAGADLQAQIQISNLQEQVVKLEKAVTEALSGILVNRLKADAERRNLKTRMDAVEAILREIY
ncbi:uncharacterized protein RSE6_03480 [Rhynchosporium secalis]|uniref:Uncharacterized protein n=1 Tax=Rhynchosporium secalis TaxID=38038 RepID=A0A1E1M2W9_RHYSE|nr:uncharacterized protein RSE6_03480 [Rhynchosporium secalis]